MKKALIILFLFSITLSCFAARQSKDSVIINDGWYKRTPAKEHSRMKDSLLKNNNEMIIINPAGNSSSTGKSSSVRIIKTSSPKAETRKNIKISFPKKETRIEIQRAPRNPRFRGHWEGIYFGFVNFDADHLAENETNFMELDYGRSFSFQGNFLEKGIELSDNDNGKHGFISGLGLEYQRLIFQDNNQTITQNEQGIIVPKPLPSEWNVKRSSLKTLYLKVPFLYEMEFHSHRRHAGIVYFSFGVVGGMRLHSKTKVVYNNEHGRKKRLKETDTFNLAPFKADAFAQVGLWSDLSIWGSYTFTKLFRNNKGPELQPYAIGIAYHF